MPILCGGTSKEAAHPIMKVASVLLSRRDRTDFGRRANFSGCDTAGAFV
ncbi:MAG: hypothetical protein KDB27_16875 [Planctomycetales bacterium]|nr:hypothetical protein [Planctomycetales bacterium]